MLLRKSLKVLPFSIVTFLVICFASTSFASSCNNPIVIPIKFSPGQSKWIHRGVGTHFFGYFKKGQHISIGAASGTKHDTTGDLSWTMNNPWQLSIEGPGGFTKFADTNSGVLYVDKVPASGKYVITMGPCAEWGRPGTVLVYASDPRLIIE